MASIASPVSSFLPPTMQPTTGNSPLVNQVQGQENQLATVGGSTFNAGQPVFASGVGTEQQGAAALGPVISYFSKLLGSNADLTSALGPQFDTISEQFNNIRQSIMANAPRSGGTASTFAEAPFKEAAAKGQIASQARGQAASGLTSAASTLGGIGASEAGAGLAESGLGLQAITDSIEAALTQRGQNIESTAATEQMLGSLGEGIGTLLGGIFEGKG